MGDDQKEPSGRDGFYRVNSQEELLGIVVARIDERTRNTDLRMGEVARELSELRTGMGTQYVSRTEFSNLAEKVNLHQKILFSVIGLVCLTVFGALLTLVVQHAK